MNRKYEPSVVDFAYQIVDMQRRLDAQEEELEILRDYKKKYMELLDQNIAHGRELMGGMLTLAMDHARLKDNILQTKGRKDD